MPTNSINFYTFVLELIKSSGFSAIIGALTGLVGGYLLNSYTYRRDEKAKAKATLTAIKAEITSIVTLMEFANYEDGIKKAIEYIEKNNVPYYFQVPVQIDLFTKVYSANVSMLGSIREQLLPDIVTFYALVHGLVMDLEHFKPVPEPHHPKLAENMLRIYKADLQRISDTIKLGKKIYQFT